MSADGQLIAGRYRLENRIGAGAMGVVWQAHDELLHRVVAIKQLLLQAGLDPAEAAEARERAMREGRIAARLHHPNAISVFDVTEDNGQPCLVMEYLPSKSLSAVMQENGPLPPREVARVGAEVAKALSAAHAAGIVHRDIKPGNILLGDNGTVKITDFGISRAQGDVTVTKTGMLAGTPAYLSPDVAIGREPSPASDVFSLGSTLYAAVEGQPPFGLSENTLALLHSVAAGAVQPPQHAGPLTATLMWLLKADPDKRPDMDRAGSMLQAVAEGFEGPSMPSMPAIPYEMPTQVVGDDQTTRALGASPNVYGDNAADATMVAGAAPTSLVERPMEPPAKSSKKPLLIFSLVVLGLLIGGAILAATMLHKPAPQPGPSPVNNQQTETSAPLPPPPTTDEMTTSEPVYVPPTRRTTRTTTATTTTEAPVTTTTQAPPTTTTQQTTTTHQTTTTPPQSSVHPPTT